MSKWSDEKFRHRRYERSHEVCYWQGNKACSVETADLARVEAYGLKYCATMDFRLPDEQRRMENIEQMLEHAFERGDESARKDIRTALGCHR